MTQRKQSFITNAAILAAAMIGVRFLGFLYHVPLTNLIGDLGNAYYGVGFQIYSFVLIVSSAGLPAAISKMVSERVAHDEYYNAHQVFRAAMYVAVVAGIAGALFLLIFAGPTADLLRRPESVYAIRSLSPTVLIVAVMAVLRGYFMGMHNAVPTALSQIVEQIFNAVFSVLLAYVLFDASRLELAAAGGTAGTGVGALAGLIVLIFIYKLAAPSIKKRVKADIDTGRRENHKDLRKIVLATAFPVIVGSAIFSISNLIDAAMVTSRLTASGAFTDFEITALYGQLSGKYTLMITLPVSISAAMSHAVLPTIRHSIVTGDLDGMHKKTGTAIRLSMIISIPAAVGLGVLSNPILSMLFPNHSEGGALITWGAVSVIFLALMQILTGVLQGIDKLRIPMYGAMAGVAIKLPLNYFLIAVPGINVIGAVISTCFCYLVAAIVNLYFLHRYTGIAPDYKNAFLKPAAAAVAMGLSAYASYHVLAGFSGNIIFCTMTAIGIAVLVYFTVMSALNGFLPEDFYSFKLGRKLLRWVKM
ncbi:MAG: polysaccharide biosynthesis protein [Defluviitaleaceae bacterium]|nr:polysaccharide biosynthesis protein [Defluviitaleaceae bacterium]